MSERAPELPRTLSFRDLLLFKLVAIVNMSLLTPQASLGRPALWLWAAAFVLFFVPEVVAVLALSKRYPDEGGLYTWANRQFGPTHGFISGWYYWTGNLFYFPMQLVYLAGVIAYAAQGADSRLVDDKTFVAMVALGWLALVTAINFVGLGVGKWLPNVGAVCTAFTAVLIASAGVVAWRSGAPAPAPADLPSAGELFAGLSVMCFAFMGVELASTMGSEIRNPERDLPRAAMAAGALTLATYVSVTWALQQLLPAGDIGAIEGILQGVDLGVGRLGLEWLAAPLAAVMAVSLAGGLAAWYAGSTRIPFVAGFTHALPSALGRVHPRWGSPYVALFTQGALTVALIATTMWGSTVREGYQVLLRSSVITTLVPFCYMFAGLVRLRDEPAWKRAAGVVGLLVSTVGMMAAFVPGEDVGSVPLYEAKLLAGSLLPLAMGLAFFARARYRARRAGAGLLEFVTEDSGASKAP
jgi:amino acid transporter